MMTMLFPVLFVVSLFTAVFVCIKVRKEQFLTQDAIYWIAFSIILIVLSLFPGISAFFAELLGFEATQNFIFAVFIFLLLIKVFLLSVKVSMLERKIDRFIHRYAIDKAESEDEKEKKD